MIDIPTAARPSTGDFEADARTHHLSFHTLRRANLARLPHFRNRHGELAHSDPDGRDWSPAQWLQAVIGELGEYANLRKKHERGDIDHETFTAEAADELADVVIYLDILAHQLDIELDQAVRRKFNETSNRVGAPIYLAYGSDAWYFSTKAQTANEKRRPPVLKVEGLAIPAKLKAAPRYLVMQIARAIRCIAALKPRNN